MGYYYAGGPGSWFPILGFIMMLAFLAVVVFLVAFFFRRPIRHIGMHDHDGMWRVGNALSILNERFARGEIDIDEYNQKKEALKQQE
jgi:uncharacterized membrane protein